jgi:hypothetical protein
MNQQASPYPYRIEPAIREGAEKLAKVQDRSLNWMLNHLLRPVVAAELAKCEAANGKPA